MLRGQGGLLGCWSGSVRGPSGNDAQAASTALPAPAAERPAPHALGRARRRRARAGISFEGKLQLVAFCVFEACVGLFWPSMMKMRSQHVPEETRSTIINFFRIPLNLFVCVVLYNVRGPPPPPPLATETGSRMRARRKRRKRARAAP